jgi:hypothetical protein
MLQKVCWLVLANWSVHLWSCFNSALVNAKFEILWVVLWYVNIKNFAGKRFIE